MFVICFEILIPLNFATQEKVFISHSKFHKCSWKSFRYGKTFETKHLGNYIKSFTLQEKKFIVELITMIVY